MRLVIVAHSFPRWPGDVAGSFLGRLASAYVSRGHTVSVVSPAHRGQGGRTEIDGVPVLQVRYAAAEREDLAYGGDMHRRVGTPAGAWTFLRLLRSLRAEAREEARRIDAQVVHAFWWVPAGWAVAGGPLPTVVSLMGTDVALMRRTGARFLARRVLTRAARVTALSTFLADEARRIARLGALEIDRVPVPVDTSRFATRRPGGGGIVYLGRLTPQKRVHLLLDAVARTGLDAPLTIIGDGPAREDLERLAARSGLRRVRFLGVVPDDQVPGIVGGADVMAFPSQGEGLGLAAAEALMLGVPVVATTDGGGVLDLVTDGDGAFIVQPTAAAMGAALARCLGDGATRAAAGRVGDMLRGQLTPDAVAAQFERIYDRIA